MEQKEARRLFSDYLEGQLPDAARRELEAHLALNEQARAELSALRKTLQSIAQLAPQQPPEEFAHQIERRISIRSRGRFFAERIATRVPFEWFSFIIIIVLLTLYLMLVLQGRRIVPPADQTSQPAQSAPAKPTNGTHTSPLYVDSGMQ